MDGLYDTDVLEWSERQASVLRRIAAGEPGNEAPDWANVIEEVEDVGRRQSTAVRSMLVQALTHDLKCQAWPDAPYVPRWRAKARGFRGDAADAFTPSLRQRIDIGMLYQRALDRLPESVDGQPPLAVPQEGPATLDEMLGRRTPCAALACSPADNSSGVDVRQTGRTFLNGLAAPARLTPRPASPPGPPHHQDGPPPQPSLYERP